MVLAAVLLTAIGILGIAGLGDRTPGGIPTVAPGGGDGGQDEQGVPDPFAWDPGQYLQLAIPAVGATRAYSMANAPDGSRDLEFLIRLLPGGKISGHLAAGLAEGEPVRLRGPFGQFTFRDDARPVFVAGGTGLAPILAILRSLVLTAPAIDARLVFGTAQESDLFGVDELAALRRALPNLKIVTTVERPTADWPHEVGRVTEHLGPIDATRSYYLCGPPGMIAAAEELMWANGVPRDHVHVERFLETGDEQP